MQKTRRHARKIETVLVPFFPGYLFVALNLSRDRWRSVNGTHGVASLVMQGSFPAPVPEGVIEALLASRNLQGFVAWQPDLEPGQSVRILTGAFTGLIGELDGLDAAGRIRVLLDIMGGRVPIVLPHGGVVSAQSAV